MCQNTALMQEGEILTFDKEKELEIFKEQYEKLLEKSNADVTLLELVASINSLETRIKELIEIKLVEVKKEYLKQLENLKNIKDSKVICPQCKQEIQNKETAQKLEITYKNKIKLLLEKIETMKNDAKEMIVLRKQKINQYNLLQTPEVKNIEGQKQILKLKIDSLQKEKNEIMLNNKEVESKQKLIKEAKNMLEILYKANIEMKENLEKNKQKLEIADRLKREIIKEQLKSVKQYLNHVTIELSHLNEATGEIKDAYIVKYDGIEYKNLSKSYKMRADFEISNLISKATEINSPMIDDAESITEINTNVSKQILVSIVVSKNEVEVLYDYDKVLEKIKESIDKQIANSTRFVLSNAA